MKKYLFLAMAIAMVVSCADESFVGNESLKEANEHSVIGFNMSMPAMTRADRTGATAAADLNKTFYVYGIKNESVNGAGNVQSGNLVFNNYVVKWTDNTAFTTTSNTENWEYVGYTLSGEEQSNITANSGDNAQTIKYWDFGAADYTFYAFSALPADISSDKVKVEKVQDKKTTDSPAHTVYDNGYTVTLAADADLDNLFFSERVPITKSDNTDRTKDNTYGGNVTFRFHRMSTKVRVAMYETIPGYSVTINKFSVDDDGADPAFSDMADEVTANFAANFQNVSAGTAGTMTVTYQRSGTTVNHPTVSLSGTTTAKVLALGSQLAQNATIGETVTDATYDQTSKAYTSVFPKENNAQNLKLKLTYTLTAPVTGETIVVSDATAEIPAQYLTWKPGYAYTYIFKITDDKLYPITFDAVEVVDEDGIQETITTVTEPSITTYAKGQILTTNNEYTTGSNIYVVVGNGTALTVGDNAKLYIASQANTLLSGEGYHDSPAQGITEASVANVLEKGTQAPTGTWTVKDANNWNTVVTIESVPTLTEVTEIAAADAPDGVAISINGAKFTPTVAGYYVFQYLVGTTVGTYDASTAAAYNAKLTGAIKEGDAAYSFNSYGSNDGTNHYGTGKAKLVSQDGEWTAVLVTNNTPDDSNAANFVGTTYYVHSTTIIAGTYYQLYTTKDTSNGTGIYVTVETSTYSAEEANSYNATLSGAVKSGDSMPAVPNYQYKVIKVVD